MKPNPAWILFAAIVLLCAAASPARAANADTIELFNGQVFHGAVNEPSLAIATSLGTLTTPLAGVSSLACQPAPRVLQTLTLSNGDILTGRVQNKTIHFTDPTIGPTELQLSQISRVVIEARSDAAPTTNPSATLSVQSLGGDHLTVLAPDAITFRSRWGDISLKGDILRQLVLVDHNQPAHRLILSDGSIFSGMVTQQTLDLHPAASPDITLTTPIGQIAKLISISPDAALPGPKLDMIGGDVLRGAIQGNLTLQTQFGPVSVSADDIRGLAPEPDSPGDITATLRDGRVLKGSPQDAPVPCKLVCGLTLNVPAAMISAYTASAPITSTAPPRPTNEILAQADPATLDHVQTLLKQMAGNNAAVKTRDQNNLVSLGKTVVPILTQLRPDQPPKVQAQIDAILQRIGP